jgi:hypothetical protein
MPDDLRDRVLAAVRKGLAGPLDTSKTKKPVLRGYSVDSATENGVTAQAPCNTAFANEIKDVTPLHSFSAKRVASREKSWMSQLWRTGQPQSALMVLAAGSRSSSCRRLSGTGRSSAFSNSSLRPRSTSPAGSNVSRTGSASSPSEASRLKRWAGRRRTCSASTPRQNGRTRLIGG